MLAREFPEFEALIRNLEKLYGKTVDDDMVRAYWGALRELPLDTVRRRIEEHIKRAKFFPKPAELRPKEDAPALEHSEKSRREFDAAVAQNVRNWDERLKADTIGTKWLLLDVYVARTDAQEDPSSVIHAERMAFARDACERLLRESGHAFAGSNPSHWRPIGRLLGGEVLQRVIEAQRKQSVAA